MKHVLQIRFRLRSWKATATPRDNLGTKEQLSFNQHFECPVDHIRYEEPEPHLFSFNNPIGACPKCQGFGRAVGLDMDLIVPNKEKSLRDGAIQPWTTPKFRENLRDLFSIAAEARVPMNVPFAKLTPEQLNIVMNRYGRQFDGINGFFKMVERKAYKIQYRVLLSKYAGTRHAMSAAGLVCARTHSM